MTLGYNRNLYPNENILDDLNSLRMAGCTWIFSDIYGENSNFLPERTRLVNYVNEGDTIVIISLARLGLSIQDIIGFLKSIGNIKIHSMDESIFLNSTDLIKWLKNIDRLQTQLASSKTRFGIQRVKKNGVVLGRRKGPNDELLQLIMKLELDVNETIVDKCKKSGVSKSTYYRYLKLIKER